MSVATRILVAAAAACMLAPAASAARVGWNETAKVNGVAVMSYRVDSLSVGKSGWTAHVSFRNVSKASIGVGSGFGVAFYGDRTTETVSGVLGFASATKFSSTPPNVLKPGASWTGVISGHGTLGTSGKVYARVVFGPFTGLPGESRSVVWITDHATALGSGTVSPPAAGPVI